MGENSSGYVVIWRIFWCLEIKPPLFWSLKKLSEIKYGKDLVFRTRFILLSTLFWENYQVLRRGLNKELSSSFSSTLFWDYLLKPVIWQHALYYVFKRREGFTYTSYQSFSEESTHNELQSFLGYHFISNFHVPAFYEQFSAQIFEHRYVKY